MHIANYHYWHRYQKLVEHRRIFPAADGEIHHIIPKCMGGTNCPENLVKLSYREHYIAHYLLAKATEADSLWYAFNMMRRVCEGKSVLYEAARKYISAVISRTNTGWIPDQEFRDAVSVRTKNTVIVKDTVGNIFRVSVTDPKYLSGEFVFYRTGTNHKQSTKDKMSENGIKNHKICHNTITGDWMYLKDGDPLPKDHCWGAGPKFSKIAKARKKTSLWYSNPDTLECKRFGSNDIIPEGFIRGRLAMKGNINGKLAGSQ